MNCKDCDSWSDMYGALAEEWAGMQREIDIAKRERDEARRLAESYRDYYYFTMVCATRPRKIGKMSKLPWEGEK